jgi:hypothetical protein
MIVQILILSAISKKYFVTTDENVLNRLKYYFSILFLLM